MKQSTIDWIKAADDDLKTIGKLIPDTSLTNIVAFHCQQVIEKVLKALLEESSLEPVRTHNLQTLILKTEGIINLSFDEVLIAEIDRLYIDARYPGDNGLMPWGKPTLQEALQYFEQAKEIKKQVEEHLKILGN